MISSWRWARIKSEHMGMPKWVQVDSQVLKDTGGSCDAC